MLVVLRSLGSGLGLGLRLGLGLGSHEPGKLVEHAVKETHALG